MANSKAKTFNTYLRCNKCGKVETIQRLSSRAREIGHQKPLYCISCKKRTKHTEISEFDNYEGGNSYGK